MGCTYIESDEEKTARFNETSIYNSPATVLLCEAMCLLEQHQLTHEISDDLKAFWERHTREDEERLRAEIEEANTVLERNQLLEKLTDREKELLGIT